LLSYDDIFTHGDTRYSYENCSCYEIYPQSKTPQLTQIAYLDFSHFPNNCRDQSYILSDYIIWYNFVPYRRGPGIILRVWDYQLNASASFIGEVDLKIFDSYKTVEV
jgi:hypothetical protein